MYIISRSNKTFLILILTLKIGQYHSIIFKIELYCSNYKDYNYVNTIAQKVQQIAHQIHIDIVMLWHWSGKLDSDIFLECTWLSNMKTC